MCVRQPHAGYSEQSAITRSPTKVIRSGGSIHGLHKSVICHAFTGSAAAGCKFRRLVFFFLAGGGGGRFHGSVEGVNTKERILYVGRQARFEPLCCMQLSSLSWQTHSDCIKSLRIPCIYVGPSHASRCGHHLRSQQELIMVYDRSDRNGLTTKKYGQACRHLPPACGRSAYRVSSLTTHLSSHPCGLVHSIPIVGAVSPLCQ